MIAGCTLGSPDVRKYGSVSEKNKSSVCAADTPGPLDMREGHFVSEKRPFALARMGTPPRTIV